MYTYDAKKAESWDAYARAAWAYVRGESDECPPYAKKRIRTYRENGYDFEDAGLIGFYLLPLAFEQFIGWDGKPNRCPIWDTIQEAA